MASLKLERKHALVIGLVGYFFLSRLSYLESIPGFIWDEGSWLVPPKNLVLFGEASFGDVDFHYATPLYHGMLTLLFSLVGPSIVAGRVFSAILGGLSLLLLFAIVRRVYNRQVAWMSVILLAFNGIMTINNRTAILETSQLFFMLLTAWLWTKGTRQFQVFAAFAFVCALSVKANAIYFAVPVALLDAGTVENPLRVIIHSVRRHIRLILLLGLTISGLGVGLVLVDVANVSDLWIRIITFHYGVPDPELFLNSMKYFLIRMPLTILLAAGAIAHSLRRHPREDSFVLSWLLAGILMHAFLQYQPYWYYFTLIPPLCIFVSTLIHRFFLSARRTGLRRLGIVTVTLICLFQVSLLVGYYFVLDKRDSSRADVARYLRDNVPQDEVIMAPHFIGVNVPNRTIGPNRHGRRADITAFGVRYIVFDKYENLMPIAKDVDFLETACRPMAAFGTVEIFKVDDDR